MVHKCCISSCGMSVRSTGSKGLSYHAFPVKEPSREKWLQAVLPHVDKPELFRIVQGYTRVCSRHFRKRDYSIDSRKRARLSSNAIPTGFPGRDIREASQPIRTERAEHSCYSTKTRSVSIRPTEGKVSVPVPKDVTPILPNEDKESGPVLITITASAADQQYQGFSEDDTASSTFSSQEEYLVTREQHKTSSKPNGKVRKRRKHRATLPVLLNCCKKRSANGNEDLNIEGVGDALAEINLSALISTSSDLLIRETQNESGKVNFPSVSFGPIKVEPLFLHPAPYPPKIKVNNFLNTKAVKQNEEQKVTNTLRSASVDKEKDIPIKANFEYDLMKSIQAVSIGPSPTIEAPNQVPDVGSLSLDNFVISTDNESLVSSRLHDLYADLVNGGASLSLEDSTPTIFDSQLLIDALQGVVDELDSGASIDQLARDLDDSFLDDTLTPPYASRIGEVPSDDVPSFLLVPQRDGSPLQAAQGIPNTDLKTSSTPHESTDQELLHKRSKEESESSPERESIQSRTRGKSTKKDKVAGSFSVERFRKSDKDIEYYTGFQTFENFDAFFISIESYMENLKVTDMVYGVANLGLSVSSEESVVPTEGPPELPSAASDIDEPKRRLSQGRSMSRKDEMFMTIVRLRRKIPEKVLGHMFCISQPSVSRIIRAWTMLLYKILELTSDVKRLPIDKSSNEKSLDIPLSFRQLFHSEVAQNIISSGNAALNSRKTSSSTKCPSIFRCKRPKKDKVVGQPPNTAEQYTNLEPALSSQHASASGVIDPQLADEPKLPQMTHDMTETDRK